MYATLTFKMCQNHIYLSQQPSNLPPQLLPACTPNKHIERTQSPKLRLLLVQTQSQSKWLGHFGVSLSPQCWCTRFGDQTATNNFKRDEGSTRREKQRLVKVSQLFLSETLVFMYNQTHFVQKFLNNSFN